MRFKREAKIAIVVSVIIFLFIWGFQFLKGKNLFSSYNYYYAVFDKVDGLQKSSIVTIRGYTVGLVSDISFASDTLNRLVVEIGVIKDFKIPDNSTMTIVSDLLGTKSVDLITGSSSNIAANGSFLRDSIGSSIFDIIEEDLKPVIKNADNMITSVDSLLQVLHHTFDLDMQQNMQNIVANVEAMIASERRKIAAILTNFESVSSNLRGTNEDISSLITNLNKFSETLTDVDLKNTVETANNSLTQLNNMLQGINTGQGTLGKFVTNDSLYLHLQEASNSLDKLLIDLRENPKRYVHFSLFGRKK